MAFRCHVDFQMKRNRKTPPRDDPAQSGRFIETARKIEADESLKVFERAFGKIVSLKRKKGDLPSDPI